jgi:hypothetical protein
MAESFQQVRFLRWRIRFIKAMIRTADGKMFRAKVDKEVRREFAGIARAAKSLDHL